MTQLIKALSGTIIVPALDIKKTYLSLFLSQLIEAHFFVTAHLQKLDLPEIYSYTGFPVTEDGERNLIEFFKKFEGFDKTEEKNIGNPLNFDTGCILYENKCKIVDKLFPQKYYKD